jgi:hypothetical protein
VVGIFIFSPAKIKDDSVAMNDRGGADKDFGIVEEHLVADEDIIENEEALAQELTVMASEDANLLEAPIVEEAEEIADDEVVNPMYDGYYEGDLTVDDLEKIERSKIVTREDVDANTVTTGASDNLANGANKNTTNNVPATVVDATDTDLVINEQKDEKPGNLAKQQKDKSNRDKKKDRFAKKAEVNQNADVVLAEDDQVFGGAYQQVTDSTMYFNYRTEINEKETLDGKMKEKSEIRPYSMHVNETKELKKLFTVFK